MTGYRRPQLALITPADLLLMYGEWLDVNGFIQNPDLDPRSHEDLAAAFLDTVPVFEATKGA